MLPSLPSRRLFVSVLAAIPFGLAAVTRADADILPLADDPQPHMRAALASLKAAKGHLQEATPDKGGHRAKALESVATAIKETEEGIAFDNRH
jgi:hypothetical protein